MSFKNQLILILTLGLSFGLSFAGDQPNSSDKKEQTIQGCLSQPASDYYMLTADDSGQKQYRITGDTAALATHVGHTISLTGNVIVSARATYGAGSWDRNGGFRGVGADAALNTGTLQMKHFSDVSPSCSAK